MKLLKPVYEAIHQQGATADGYLDDILIIGDCFNSAYCAINCAVLLLTGVGFLYQL